MSAATLAIHRVRFLNHTGQPVRMTARLNDQGDLVLAVGGKDFLPERWGESAVVEPIETQPEPEPLPPVE